MINTTIPHGLDDNRRYPQWMIDMLRLVVCVYFEVGPKDDLVLTLALKLALALILTLYLAHSFDLILFYCGVRV